MRGRRTAVLVMALCLSGLTACDPDRGEAPLQPELARSALEPGQAVPIPELAWALAQSMADESVRSLVRDYLRDSPFPEGRLHVNSLLPRSSLLSPLAERLSSSTEDLTASIRSSVDFEILIPSSLSRILWDGGPEVYVGGVPLGYDGTEALAAYTPFGDSVVTYPWENLAAPVIVVRDATLGFGSDPEATREAQGRRFGSTVSNRVREGFVEVRQAPEPLQEASDSPALTEIGCWDEHGNYIECPPGEEGGGSSMADYVLPSGYGMSQCTGSYHISIDEDQDGVRDVCEFQVAYAFRPILALNPGDGTPSREPYWAVKYEAGYLKVLYALGYHKDGGFPNSPDPGHYGDSEVVVLWVQNTSGNRWNVWQIFFSAHLGEGWGFDDSELVPWSAQQLTWPLGERGRPLVWVAQDKHANFKSRFACEQGGGWETVLGFLVNLEDNCTENSFDLNSYVYDVDIRSDANLGSQTHHLVDCVTTRFPPFYPGTECFWNQNTEFAGWYTWFSGQKRSASYWSKLYAFDFWSPPPPPPPGGGDPPDSTLIEFKSTLTPSLPGVVR